MILMRTLSKQIRALWRNKRANVAIITALSALPMIGMMGLAADYALAIMTKAKLDSAADAAAVAAVTTAQSVIAANNGDTGTALADGAARGLAIFNANMGAVGFLTGPPTLDISDVKRTGQTLTETVTYTVTQRNNFGSLFNVPTTQIKGTSVVSQTVGQYLDFYLLLDVSGSMGFPSTQDGAKLLASKAQDETTDYPTGCVFACHIPNAQGFNVARQNGIQLRADAVGNAVCQLIQTAKTKTTAPKQYRVGVYPFIVDMEPFSILSSDLDHVMSDVNGGVSGGCSTATPASAIGNLLDTGDTSSQMGSGGTHFEIVLPHINQTITSVGDGSSSGSTKPFVFLVTDGLENKQGFQGAGNGSYWWSSGSQPQLMDPSKCATLKGRGITVAVLNIPYQLINNPNYNYANNEDGKTNSAISGNPNIATTLKNCASSGFYFTANTPADITDAMNAMFSQAVQQTQITK